MSDFSWAFEDHDQNWPTQSRHHPGPESFGGVFRSNLGFENPDWSHGSCSTRSTSSRTLALLVKRRTALTTRSTESDQRRVPGGASSGQVLVRFNWFNLRSRAIHVSIPPFSGSWSRSNRLANGNRLAIVGCLEYEPCLFWARHG